MFKTLQIFVLLLLSAWIYPVSASSISTVVAAESTAAPHPENAHAYAKWEGLWTGPEGIFVFITLAGPGEYELEMIGETEDMKDNIRLTGRDAVGGISFDRNGKTLLLRSATGEETGLKWLADMKNCLMVEEFEGFCRD